jgi:hypothetical protein
MYLDSLTFEVLGRFYNSNIRGCNFIVVKIKKTTKKWSLKVLYNTLN